MFNIKTVAQLIEELQKCPADAEVYAINHTGAALPGVEVYVVSENTHLYGKQKFDHPVVIIS